MKTDPEKSPTKEQSTTREGILVEVGQQWVHREKGRMRTFTVAEVQLTSMKGFYSEWKARAKMINTSTKQPVWVAIERMHVGTNQLGYSLKKV